ncbi:hypothetical protein AAFP35_24315 [Gordonia sp. CPCC 206044]|uniref:hypothetical protein n=1 Tax=Gordonia sp. CPCC 206044 TaxID=3140793 RepID=UPI003AF33FB6
MTTRRHTTTSRGLGWTHQQAVQRLKTRHIDGSPCWWCGQPMYRDRRRNWDHASLEGDHSTARSRGGTIADRLLHMTCNRERGDGSRDHLRPALGTRRDDADLDLHDSTGFYDDEPQQPETDDDVDDTDVGALAMSCWSVPTPASDAAQPPHEPAPHEPAPPPRPATRPVWRRGAQRGAR